MGNQSGIIFGAIVVGFVVFITLKGELPTYAGLLLLAPKDSGTGTAGKTAQSSDSTVTQITKGIIQGAILGIGG